MKGYPTTWRYRTACGVLSDSPGPFPIAEALASFGKYRDSIWVSKGGNAGTGKAKLGPVFSAVIGETGSASARPTPDAWIILVRTGSGDCPAGCINHQDTYYQVTRMGTVSLTNAEDLFGNCSTLSAIRANPRSPAQNRASRFTLEGRKVRSIAPPRSAAWVEGPQP